MSKRYHIPAEQTRTEIEVKKSRFIATLAPVFSVAEAKSFIQRIKAEFSDASHNVPAYQIGFGNSTTAHSNDDGEPSGTAGRPMLAVIQGSGMGDLAVVVTRYWGGTKLGTGGLVRAYSDATKAVIEVTPLAEKVPTHLAMLAIPYSYVERIRRLVDAHNGRLLDEDFAADVTITAQFTVEKFPQFQKELQEMSHGSLSAEIIETNEATIMPLNTFDHDH
ncbi:MAG: YigZ family protein [Chloroflexota bacterium]